MTVVRDDFMWNRLSDKSETLVFNLPIGDGVVSPDGPSASSPGRPGCVIFSQAMEKVMKSAVSLLARIAVIAPLALAGTCSLVSPATADPEDMTSRSLAAPAGAVPAGATTVTFQCQGTPPIGGPKHLTMTVALVGRAPASANPRDAVAITLTPSSQTVPSRAGGYRVNNLHDLTLLTPFPTNSTYVSSSLSGGTVNATLDDSDGRLAINVSDTIPGGSTFTLPAITTNVTAGTSGTITSTLAGTSYDDPGLTLTANVESPIGPLDIPISCYPAPVPTFTTTTIKGARSEVATRVR
ncbi:hypothetical protein [Nocardia sp. NPDC051570]|uniref:hypothetical protein n=1 Tax=Nocardia sp. NPDC051570 TaxID=3364324 RepID=UPI003794F5D2